MLILGIETSCDETGLALYDSERGLIDHVLHSQTDIHKDYGGVVPELASRDHIRKISPLTKMILANNQKKLADLDGIAYTSGPGLMGALLIGATFAKTLALSLQIPSLSINHMEAHLLAPMMEKKPPPFPFIALLVSGGHTQIVNVKALGEYELMGESVDDAAGEAFDKTAKILGLGYPGGPQIAAAASAARQKISSGAPARFRFPRPMTDRPGLNLSFSGLKTFAQNTVRECGTLSETDIEDISLAFEDAVVDTLKIKCDRALKKTGIDHLVIAGGVSANQHLRKYLESELSATIYYASPEFCTDNGAMIAHAGALRMSGQKQEHDLSLEIKTTPRWNIEALKNFTENI